VDRVAAGGSESTGQAAFRCGASRAAGRRWEEGAVLSQNSADLLAFDAVRMLHVAEDASRHGTPAEETNVYMAHDSLQNIGSVWAPQVLSLSLVSFLWSAVVCDRSPGMMGYAIATAFPSTCLLHACENDAK
jgi:hypothetical protein